MSLIKNNYLVQICIAQFLTKIFFSALRFTLCLRYGTSNAQHHYVTMLGREKEELKGSPNP